ncbi:DUF1904 family protein [Peribacillus alkalitolerans]|uniref:DUF1904 family protein n=1 Tax=Peribacillus alkalitolerans TaxID=1550385 RepID=UPI0013D64E36|nr:DUF1904 family protein [Peribacillus alkalitolerans]
MPHLVIRGVSIEEMKRISKPLVGELAEICECGTDNFTFEVPHSTFIFDGIEIPSFPLIEVKWFERGQETRDQLAKSITKHIMSMGVGEVEVVFIPFSEPAYYINGERVAD